MLDENGYSYFYINVNNNNKYYYQNVKEKPDSAEITLKKIERIIKENINSRPGINHSKEVLLNNAVMVKNLYVLKFDYWNNIRSWCCLPPIDEYKKTTILTIFDNIEKLVNNQEQAQPAPSEQLALPNREVIPQPPVENAFSTSFNVKDVWKQIVRVISFQNVGNLTRVSKFFFNFFEPLLVNKINEFKAQSPNLNNKIDYPKMKTDPNEGVDYLRNLNEVIKFEYKAYSTPITFIPNKFFQFAPHGIDFEKTLENISHLNESETTELQSKLNSSLISIAKNCYYIDFETIKRVIFGSQILGSNLETKENDLTTLAIACRNNCGTVARALIAAGANLEAKNDLGETPLALACKHGHLDSVRILVNAGADINAKDNNGKTPLALAIEGQRENEEVVKVLIQAGADINAQDNVGNTPLMKAIQLRKVAIIKILINESKLDYNKQNNSGKTALEIAFEISYESGKISWLEGFQYPYRTVDLVEVLISKTDLNAKLLLEPLREYLSSKNRKNAFIVK
jgi:Ankyrin repeats (3 copies)